MYSDLAKKRGKSKENTTTLLPVKSSGCRAGKLQRESGQRPKGLVKISLWICGALFVCVLLLIVSAQIFNVSVDSSEGVSDECATDSSTKEPNAADQAKSAPARTECERSEEKVVPVNVKRDEYGPRIKGLRLGMKYADVDDILRRLLEQLNGEGPKYPLHLDYRDENSIFLRSIKKDTGSFCDFRFDEGKLVLFSFKGEALQLAFGVKPENVSDEQLLQMLIDNYGIPSVKTQTFTYSEPSRFGVGGGVETLSYYDGSEREGYAFEFRGYRGTGTMRASKLWSFSVYRYLGLDFDLPPQISMSDVKKYQYGFGPVIKGFQLGMTRAEVLDLAKKIIPNAVPVEQADRLFYQDNNSAIAALDFSFKNGKVSKFHIAGTLLRLLYRVNPQYQIFKDFARRVVDYYHIPDAQGKTKSTHNQIATCYECTMNGLEFWIEENRKANQAIWAIGCRHIDTSKFD